MSSSETVQSNPMENAIAWFAEMGLPVPFIPAEMQSSLVEISKAVYGTASEKPGLYNISAFSSEFITRPTADYVRFGLGGYGMNSRALHYYLVRGSLGIFLQLGWGGVYEDQELARQSIVSSFTSVEALIHAVDTAKQSDRLPPQSRLIVESSDFYGSRWAILDGFVTPDSPTSSMPQWHEDLEALASAHQFLTRSGA
jgi:hypothetical protein